MRSERLRWLVAAEGPFASVYFDDSHDTLDAVERREATWRDVRKHLESRDAKQELIDSLEEAVRASRRRPKGWRRCVRLCVTATSTR